MITAPFPFITSFPTMISYTDPYSGTLIEYDPETKRRVLEPEGGPVIHTLPGGCFSEEVS